MERCGFLVGGFEMCTERSMYTGKRGRWYERPSTDGISRSRRTYVRWMEKGMRSRSDWSPPLTIDLTVMLYLLITGMPTSQRRLGFTYLWIRGSLIHHRKRPRKNERATWFGLYRHPEVVPAPLRAISLHVYIRKCKYKTLTANIVVVNIVLVVLTYNIIWVVSC